MTRSKLPNYSITQLPDSGERGYILITLMLFVALLSIAALAVLPEVKQQIKRDREEELIHRGTAYMRAIQHFYKKTGRYPTRIEELENTNNIRFLRKRYTDPMNRDPESHKEKDFKLLHVQDISLLTGQPFGVGAGLGAPGLAPGGPGAALPRGGALPFGPPGSQNVISAQTGGATQPVNANQAGQDQGDTGDNSGGSPNPAPVNTQVSPGGIGGGPLQANPAGGNNPLTFGGGPVLGVASLSKDKSIREFGDKYKHYNEWLFIYDPTADRGGLIKGPVVPNSNSRGGLGVPVQSINPQNPGGNQPPNPVQQQQMQNPQMPPEQ